MVQESEMAMDEIVLQIFEAEEAAFHYPLRSQKDAKAFVKALYQNGVTYEKMCEEFNEYEHNFNSWRKGLGRSGIGGKVISRINRPLEEFLEDSEDEDGEDEGLGGNLGDIVKNDTNDKLSQLEERIERLTSSSQKKESLKNGDVDINSMDTKTKEKTLEKSLGDAITKVNVEHKQENNQDDDSDEWEHIDSSEAITVETDKTSTVDNGDSEPAETDPNKKDTSEKAVTNVEQDTKANANAIEKSEEDNKQHAKPTLQLADGDVGETNTDTTNEATSPLWDKSMLKSTGIKDPRAKATENGEKTNDKDASSPPWAKSKLRSVKSNDDTPVPKLDLEPEEPTAPGSPAWSRSNLRSVKGDQNKPQGGKLILDGGDIGESNTDDVPWARSKLKRVSDKKIEPTRKGSGKKKEPAPWGKSMLKSAKHDSESETSSTDDSTQISPRRSSRKDRDGTVFGIKLKPRTKDDDDHKQKSKGDKNESLKDSSQEKLETKKKERVGSSSSSSDSSPVKDTDDAIKQVSETKVTKETNHKNTAEKEDDNSSNAEPKSEKSDEKSQTDTPTEGKENDIEQQAQSEEASKTDKESDAELPNDLENQNTYLSINFNSDTEDVDDENTEQTTNTELKELREKLLALHSANQNGPGYLYVLTDSPKYAKQQRLRVATSRFPHKRLKQAQQFNVDIRMVTKAMVSRQSEALEEARNKLKAFKVEGQDLWFKGPMDVMISKVNRVSAQLGVLV